MYAAAAAALPGISSSCIHTMHHALHWQLQRPQQSTM
jgi:hypothetical protein